MVKKILSFSLPERRRLVKMYKSNKDFNYARKEAFKALCSCIDKCINKDGITEKMFSQLWINELSQNSDIIVNGWYSPPPMGIAVLSGNPVYPSRVNYDSLRNPTYWPQEKEINWLEDIFYVYYSPVSISNGIPGDISVTLYFGNDIKIKEHFKKTHVITEEILNNIDKCHLSSELFELYQNLLNEHGLLGCGLSSTDPALTNIGHTLPEIKLNRSRNMSDEQRKDISNARKFINGITSWTFDEGVQFTIEPQLMSSIDAGLPQISYHYLASKKGNSVYICDDINELLDKFYLI